MLMHHQEETLKIVRHKEYQILDLYKNYLFFYHLYTYTHFQDVINNP